MIRSFLAVLVCAAAIFLLVRSDPGSGPAREAPLLAASSVTRAATVGPAVAPARVVGPLPLQGPPMPVPVADVVVAEPVAAPDPAVAPPRQAAPIRAAMPAARVLTDDTSLMQTTAAVLGSLGLPIDLSNAPGTAQTYDVLADIGLLTPRSDAGSEPARETPLARAVADALKAGLSDREIDALVNAAARDGDILVPDVLVTADGRVDTRVLLDSIVIQARVATGGDLPEVPDVPAGEGSGVEVRVVQRATETQQYRFYTVAPGDSLGAIALKFFGDASWYPAIFQANRGLLSSPNLIQSGQRLVIPDLSDI